MTNVNILDEKVKIILAFNSFLCYNNFVIKIGETCNCLRNCNFTGILCIYKEGANTMK